MQILYPQRQGHEPANLSYSLSEERTSGCTPDPWVEGEGMGPPVSWCYKEVCEFRIPSETGGLSTETPHTVGVFSPTRNNSLPLVVFCSICVSQTQISPHQK